MRRVTDRTKIMNSGFIFDDTQAEVLEEWGDGEHLMANQRTLFPKHKQLGGALITRLRDLIKNSKIMTLTGTASGRWLAQEA